METIEIWKAIDDMYSISSRGEVINRITGKKLKLQKTGRLPKSGDPRELYLNASLRGKKKKVHRLVADAFVPNPDDLPQVDHIDGNKSNNVPSNLEWVSNQTNVQRAYRNNLINPSHGISHHATTHTEKQVKKAIKMLLKNEPYSKITKKTNLSSSELSDIKNKRIWKEFTKDIDFPNVYSKPDYTKYHEQVDALILKGLKTKKIRKLIDIPNFTSQQWRSLVYLRKKSLKKRGLL